MSQANIPNAMLTTKHEQQQPRKKKNEKYRRNDWTELEKEHDQPKDYKE